jgi:hypothetical protein
MTNWLVGGMYQVQCPKAHVWEQWRPHPGFYELDCPKCGLPVARVLGKVKSKAVSGYGGERP